MTFDSCGANDNNVRHQAENYLKNLSKNDGMLQTLFMMITNTQETNKGRQSDVATQAAFYLKLKVQKTWGLEYGGKENVSHNMQDDDDFKRPISPQDKEFIKFNIIKALDVAPTKII